MLRIIRRNVFETNSSSTHSLTICTKAEHEAWRNGEVYLNEGWNNLKQFITKEEAIEYLKSKGITFENSGEVKETLEEEGIYAIDNYKDDYETFKLEYTTPNGDEIVAFGYYGYSG